MTPLDSMTARQPAKVYLLMVSEYNFSHVHKIYERKEDAEAAMRLLESLNDDFDKLSEEQKYDAQYPYPTFYDCVFLVREMLVCPAPQPEPCRDWTDDFSHENGNYLCGCIKCGKMFHGHKRRAICKGCDATLPQSEQKVCEWRRDSDGQRHSSCGRSFWHMGRQPNCVFCGLPIREVLP